LRIKNIWQVLNDPRHEGQTVVAMVCFLLWKSLGVTNSYSEATIAVFHPTLPRLLNHKNLHFRILLWGVWARSTGGKRPLETVLMRFFFSTSDITESTSTGRLEYSKLIGRFNCFCLLLNGERLVDIFWGRLNRIFPCEVSFVWEAFSQYPPSHIKKIFEFLLWSIYWWMKH